MGNVSCVPTTQTLWGPVQCPPWIEVPWQLDVSNISYKNSSKGVNKKEHMNSSISAVCWVVIIILFVIELCN